MKSIELGHRYSEIQTSINGVKYTLSFPSKYTLAELLREKLNLTGTKLGCNRAECGVCTVLSNGIPVFSCTMLAVEANHKEIQTVEGLSLDPVGRTLQREFVKEDALQCGFCTPGILMSLKAVLQGTSAPNLEEIKESIAGNYCRCGAYPNIFEAAHRAREAKFEVEKQS